MSKIIYKKRSNPVAKQLREPRYRKQETSDRTKYSRPREKKTSLEQFRSIFSGWTRRTNEETENATRENKETARKARSPSREGE